jgi:hypothetical protein
MRDVEYPSNVKFYYAFNETRHFAFTIAYRPIGFNQFECGVSYHCSVKQNLSRRQGRMVAYNRLTSSKKMDEKYKFVFYFDPLSLSSRKEQMLYALAKNNPEGWVVGLVDKGINILTNSRRLKCDKASHKNIFQ